MSGRKAGIGRHIALHRASTRRSGPRCGSYTGRGVAASAAWTCSAATTSEADIGGVGDAADSVRRRPRRLDLAGIGWAEPSGWCFEFHRAGCGHVGPVGGSPCSLAVPHPVQGRDRRVERRHRRPLQTPVSRAGNRGVARAGEGGAGRAAARRTMADSRWRDLPDRSTIGPKSVSMRFERGVGDGSGTVTYVLTGDGESTTVRLSLVGSIHGRWGCADVRSSRGAAATPPPPPPSPSADNVNLHPGRRAKMVALLLLLAALGWFVVRCGDPLAIPTTSEAVVRKDLAALRPADAIVVKGPESRPFNCDRGPSEAWMTLRFAGDRDHAELEMRRVASKAGWYMDSSDEARQRGADLSSFYSNQRLGGSTTLFVHFTAQGSSTDARVEVGGELGQRCGVD